MNIRIFIFISGRLIWEELKSILTLILIGQSPGKLTQLFIVFHLLIRFMDYKNRNIERLRLAFRKDIHVPFRNCIFDNGRYVLRLIS